MLQDRNYEMPSVIWDFCFSLGKYLLKEFVFVWDFWKTFFKSATKTWPYFPSIEERSCVSSIWGIRILRDHLEMYVWLSPAVMWKSGSWNQHVCRELLKGLEYWPVRIPERGGFPVQQPLVWRCSKKKLPSGQFEL